MTPETFLENFNQLAGTPGAVKRLRELILQLAVTGKLVSQDPNDEPASVLLKKIAAEKARLVREGKIRKSEPLPPIKPEDVPFELPEGWEWVRLGNIGTVGSSSRVHQRDWSDQGIPFYRAREIVKLSQNGFVDNELFISEDLYQSLSSNGIMPEEDDIMLTGVGTIGVPYVVRKDDRFYFKDASVLILKNHFNLFSTYLQYFFQSPYWVNDIHKESMGTTVHTLTIVRANSVLLPFPPDAEQRRIVARVDQLMALCDRLEEREVQAKETHNALTKSTLYVLTTADGSHAFQTAWQRIRDQFSHLFINPESVKELRQTILQLAVMGKLVPQDPNDEPASVLLKKIAAEKARLVREGKIKKSEPLPPIKPEEVPFELPERWEWCRLGMLGNVKGGGTPSKQRPEYWEGDIPWISPKDMKVDFISDSIDHINGSALDDSSVKMIEKGAMLMVVRGMILDHSFPVAITLTAVTINQDMKALELYCNSSQKYILLTFKGNLDRFLALVQRSSHGTCRVDSEKLFSLAIPIPPLTEQHRIVACVDQLMALCDRLEEQLQKTKTEGVQLMEAAIHHLSAA
ncbi:MAG: restriction endonuclease subunit S [Magnetococcales bacterium]|nr:restriction endonuclease subunit S [Magnetococcales bacterium]